MNDSHAGSARNFVTAQRSGILSTLSKREPGFPFGSIVPYDISNSGEVVIYISFIAEHYKNLEQDPHACLTIVDPWGQKDPQAFARASLLLEFAIVEKSDKEQVQSSYEKRFPASINYEIAHNFCFMKAAPAKVRWIKGFGEMSWIDGEAYAKAAVDPLAYSSHGIISHMNEDHQDAIREYVEAFSEVETEGAEVLMRGVDAFGMDIAVSRKSKLDYVRVDFLEELKEASQARQATIDLLQKARKINSN